MKKYRFEGSGSIVEFVCLSTPGDGRGKGILFIAKDVELDGVFLEVREGNIHQSEIPQKKVIYRTADGIVWALTETEFLKQITECPEEVKVKTPAELREERFGKNAVIVAGETVIPGTPVIADDVTELDLDS